MNSQHVRGNRPRVKIEFLDAAGAGVDPDNLLFKFKDVEGEETVYIYATDAEVVRDSAGHFHVDVPIDTTRTKGKVYCRYEARDAGSVVLAAAECILEVKSDYVEVIS
jgi:hypothetical protein